VYWFKHYSDASEGLSLKTLWSNKDYEAIAVFWRLCELLSTHDSRDGVLKTNFLFIARETGMKPSKCRRVLARISAVSLLRFQHDTDEIQEFLVPKWSEFQETRGKKKDKKNQIPPGDIRSKNIDIKKQITDNRIVCTELKKTSVAVPTVDKKDPFLFINQKLLELYPQEYIDREKVKMEMWLATNGHKRPKSDRGMVRFVTSWLSRGWDQYRKGLQSNAPKERSFAEVWAEEEEKRREENGS
jgi:hypothetical protein